MVHLVSHLRYKIIYLFKHLTKKKTFKNLPIPFFAKSLLNGKYKKHFSKSRSESFIWNSHEKKN